MTQLFTITAVRSVPPTFATAATATALIGGTFSFTVATTGTPAAALSLSGTLPNTFTFQDNGDGTATLTGNPPMDANEGIYPLTLTATNAAGTATQSFALSVEPPMAPSFSSGTSGTAIIGTPFSFTVVATGAPVPALSVSGPLPPTFGFADNGDGTATITGDPQVGSEVGAYPPVVVTATNSVSAVTQSLTLAVEPPLAIAGPSDYNTADGRAFDVPFSAPDVPGVSWAEAGSLPSGMTLVDNGDGTADLTGTPAADGGQEGTYPISLTVHDGLQPDVTQAFTLTVAPPSPAAFTSASTVPVTVGTPFSFAVTTTGAPTGSIDVWVPFHGFIGLPDGVTLVDHGDGTATLSGTLAAPGNYYFWLIDNGGNNGPPMIRMEITATQLIAPTIDSAAAATAITGNSFSFTVTTTGSPTPSLSVSGLSRTASRSPTTVTARGRSSETPPRTPTSGSSTR